MNEASTQLWQLKAFRGWLSAVQAMIHEARYTIDGQIEYHEGEIKRLRAQGERSLAVLESMDVALEIVDQHLTRAQDKVAGDEPSVKKSGAPRSSRYSGSAAKRPQPTARDEEILIEEGPGKVEEEPGKIAEEARKIAERPGKSTRRPSRGSHNP